MGIQKDKLTEAQKAEIERLRQFVSRNRLTTRMNSTKWRAAIDAVAAVPGYRPLFRLKLVTEKDEPAETWSAAFPGGLPLYNAIEWLELNAWGEPSPGAPPKGKRPDFRAPLKQALEAAGAPIAETPQGVRIAAYERSGSK
jgi:hypothetical protein